MVKAMALSAKQKGAVSADTILKSWNAPEGVILALEQKL
jgi:hypothetical protein